MNLHPQTQEFLESIGRNPAPSWQSLPLNRARRQFVDLPERYGIGPEEVIAADRELSLGSAAGAEHLSGRQVPVRIYRAPTAERFTRMLGETSGLRPACIFFHGGGWVLGDLDSHDTMCRRLALASGGVVVSVGYSRAPEARFPEPIDDCLAAAIAVAGQGESLGINPDELTLIGDSAGGYLAAQVALASLEVPLISPHRLVMLYPVISPRCDTESYRRFAEGYGLTRETMQWFWSQFLGGADAATIDRADLLNADVSGLPPTHVVTAGYDVLRDEGLAFVEHLKAARVDVTSTEYDGTIHAFMHFGGVLDEGVEAIEAIGKLVRTQQVIC